MTRAQFGAVGLALCTLILGAWALQQVPQEGRIAGFVTNLSGRTRGQRLNSSLAARKLDGAVIPAGEVFSFNDRVGSFSRDAGFRKAPVSYNGQLISDWGGGVCQTSTTLYNAALLAGLEVVERHAHHFSPGYVPPGRDAAVAFRSVDLRLRNPYPFPIRVRAFSEGETLQVYLIGSQPDEPLPQVIHRINHVDTPKTLRLGGEAMGGSNKALRIRNSGKVGYDVTVERVFPGRRERISHDYYPAMTRIVEPR